MANALDKKLTLHGGRVHFECTTAQNIHQLLKSHWWQKEYDEDNFQILFYSTAKHGQPRPIEMFREVLQHSVSTITKVGSLSEHGPFLRPWSGVHMTSIGAYGASHAWVVTGWPLLLPLCLPVQSPMGQPSPVSGSLRVPVTLHKSKFYWLTHYPITGVYMGKTPLDRRMPLEKNLLAIGRTSLQGRLEHSLNSREH